MASTSQHRSAAASVMIRGSPPAVPGSWPAGWRGTTRLRRPVPAAASARAHPWSPARSQAGSASASRRGAAGRRSS
eukprot:5489107-Alexandrium_andersonii.AAC.1